MTENKTGTQPSELICTGAESTVSVAQSEQPVLASESGSNGKSNDMTLPNEFSFPRFAWRLAEAKVSRPRRRVREVDLNDQDVAMVLEPEVKPKTKSAKSHKKKAVESEEPSLPEISSAVSTEPETTDLESLPTVDAILGEQQPSSNDNNLELEQLPTVDSILASSSADTDLEPLPTVDAILGNSEPASEPEPVTPFMSQMPVADVVLNVGPESSPVDEMPEQESPVDTIDEPLPTVDAILGEQQPSSNDNNLELEQLPTVDSILAGSSANDADLEPLPTVDAILGNSELASEPEPGTPFMSQMPVADVVLNVGQESAPVDEISEQESPVNAIDEPLPMGDAILGEQPNVDNNDNDIEALPTVDALLDKQPTADDNGLEPLPMADAVVGEQQSSVESVDNNNLEPLLAVDKSDLEPVLMAEPTSEPEPVTPFTSQMPVADVVLNVGPESSPVGEIPESESPVDVVDEPLPMGDAKPNVDNNDNDIEALPTVDALLDEHPSTDDNGLEPLPMVDAVVGEQQSSVEDVDNNNLEPLTAVDESELEPVPMAEPASEPESVAPFMSQMPVADVVLNVGPESSPVDEISEPESPADAIDESLPIETAAPVGFEATDLEPLPMVDTIIDEPTAVENDNPLPMVEEPTLDADIGLSAMTDDTFRVPASREKSAPRTAEERLIEDIAAAMSEPFTPLQPVSSVIANQTTEPEPNVVENDTMPPESEPEEIVEMQAAEQEPEPLGLENLSLTAAPVSEFEAEPEPLPMVEPESIPEEPEPAEELPLENTTVTPESFAPIQPDSSIAEELPSEFEPEAETEPEMPLDAVTEQEPEEIVEMQAAEQEPETPGLENLGLTAAPVSEFESEPEPFTPETAEPTGESETPPLEIPEMPEDVVTMTAAEPIPENTGDETNEISMVVPSESEQGQETVTGELVVENNLPAKAGELENIVDGLQEQAQSHDDAGEEKIMGLREKLSGRKNGAEEIPQSANPNTYVIKRGGGILTSLLLLALGGGVGMCWWQLKELTSAIKNGVQVPVTPVPIPQAPAQQAAPVDNQPVTYEYAIDFLLDQHIVDSMAQRGQDGWQVVGSRRTQDSTTGEYGYEFIFMRPVPIDWRSAQ